MATVKEDMVVKFQTTTDGDVEEVQLSAGDELYVVKEWDRHYLVRDDDGHYHNIEKDKLDE